jgi:hypothetical protein
VGGPVQAGRQHHWALTLRIASAGEGACDLKQLHDVLAASQASARTQVLRGTLCKQAPQLLERNFGLGRKLQGPGNASLASTILALDPFLGR